MNERRKSKRVPFISTMSIDSLYKSGEQKSININNIKITVTNISETGIGFYSTEELPVDHFFNCRLDFPKSSSVYCVVRIIRTKKLENSNIFKIGCELIGISSVYSNIINQYIKRFN